MNISGRTEAYELLRCEPPTELVQNAAYISEPVDLLAVKTQRFVCDRGASWGPQCFLLHGTFCIQASNLRVGFLYNLVPQCTSDAAVITCWSAVCLFLSWCKGSHCDSTDAWFPDSKVLDLTSWPVRYIYTNTLNASNHYTVFDLLQSWNYFDTQRNKEEHSLLVNILISAQTAVLTKYNTVDEHFCVIHFLSTHRTWIV